MNINSLLKDNFSLLRNSKGCLFCFKIYNLYMIKKACKPITKDAETHSPMSRNRQKLLFLGIIFVFVFFGSFSVGRYPVPPWDVLKIIINELIPLEQTWNDQMSLVVLNIRLPRVIAAALIGCALSTAGGIYQGMFKNPMVSPDILGSSAGAGFGAALGILCAFGYYGISISAFIFGLIAVIVAVAAASRFRSNVTLGLVLAGIMIGSLFQACTSFIKLVADPTDELPAITYWLMGSLASIRIYDLQMLLPVMLVGLIPLFFLRWRLNVITLSEEEARSLGVNTKRIRILVILCATLVTAASVAVSGMIGWVGLVIPHFARKLVGCDYKILLPAIMLIGGSFLMVVDNVARTLTTSEVPIGILTAFIGAPFFLYLILQGGKKRL